MSALCGVAGRVCRVLLVIGCMVGTAHANTLEPEDSCTVDVGDDSVTAERCVQRDLDRQEALMAQQHQRLRDALPAAEVAALTAAHAQWQAYRTGHCAFMVQIAGEENPAWALTWGGIAGQACEADLARDRAAQLEALGDLVARLKRQTEAQGGEH
jgi:uncharacterized protein YecT (DUF1311 family)